MTSPSKVVFAVLAILTTVLLAGCSADSGRSTPSSSSPRAERPMGLAQAGLDGQGIRIVRKDKAADFLTPTHNISCSMFTYGPVEARCDIHDHSWALPPRPSGCDYDWGASMTVGTGRAKLGLCASDAAGGRRVLPYGRGFDVGPLRCISARDGVRCENRRTGHGFWVSREQAQTF